MDKESIYLLQKVDCNCNDCIFMKRDIDKFKQSLELHHKWQFDYYTTMKNKLLEKARIWKDVKNNLAMSIELTKQANQLVFIFDKSEASINYGKCTKFNKDVSFIPNVCQIETQECFKHRRDEVNS